MCNSLFKHLYFMLIVGRGFLTSPPHSLCRHPILITPLFQILPNAPNHFHSFCCFVALAEWMDLNFSSLGTVIPAATCCVLYVTGHQISWSSDRDDMVFAILRTWFLLLLWFEITQTNIHRTKITQTNKRRTQTDQWTIAHL